MSLPNNRPRGWVNEAFGPDNVPGSLTMSLPVVAMLR